MHWRLYETIFGNYIHTLNPSLSFTITGSVQNILFLVQNYNVFKTVLFVANNKVLFDFLLEVLLTTSVCVAQMTRRCMGLADDFFSEARR